MQTYTTSIRLLSREDVLRPIWEQYHRIQQELAATKAMLHAMGATEFPDEATPAPPEPSLRERVREACRHLGAKGHVFSAVDVSNRLRRLGPSRFGGKRAVGGVLRGMYLDEDAGEFLRLAGSLMAKRPGRPGLTDAEWTARRIQHVAQADAAVAVVHLGGGKFVAGMPSDYPELDWRDGGYGYWGDDRLAHVAHDAASGRYLLQCWEPDGTPVPCSEEFATNEAAVQHAEEWLLKINVQPTPVGWTRPGDPVSADEVLVLATSFILAGTHVHLFDAPSRQPVGRASSMLQLLRAFAKVQGLFTPSTT